MDSNDLFFYFAAIICTLKHQTICPFDLLISIQYEWNIQRFVISVEMNKNYTKVMF